MDLTQLLPTETIEAVLDRVNLLDIIRASGVSHRWRAIARNHPLFWRRVHIGAASKSALACFAARISQKPDCTVSVTVDLQEETSVGVLDAVVLPLISHNLPRIDSLYLGIDGGAGESMYKHLSGSNAPELTSLAIYSRGSPSLGPVPVTLLAGHAPRLKDLSIYGALSPRSEWLFSFSSVTVLNIRFEPSGYTFRPAYRSFSSLRMLTFSNGAVPPIRELEQEDESVVSRLDVLEYDGNHTSDEFWFWQPLTRVPSIRITRSTPGATLALASHISGDLCAFLYWRDMLYWCDVSVAPANGQKRDRAFSVSRAEAIPSFHWIFYLPEIANRIVSLSIEPNFWTCGTIIGPLYRCETLNIALDFSPAYDIDPSPIGGLLRLGPQELPSLRAFIFECNKLESLSIDAGTLRSFLQLWLPLEDRSKLVIQLHRVTIDGDVTGLPPVQIHH